METERIISSFKEKVCEEIQIEQEGLGRYKVLTPFAFGDGDHFAIYLRILGEDTAFLTDEGNTFMHLSYEGFNFWEGQRGGIIEDVLTQFNIQENNGDLVLPIPKNQFGDALFTYIQAIQRITDVEFLTQERVRTTFMEDFHALIKETIKNDTRITFNYIDEGNDPTKIYPVDVCFRNSKTIHFFGIASDDKCRDSTITIHQFREWYQTGRPKPIGIFQDQSKISNRVLARFTDVGHKTFSNLSYASKELEGYLHEENYLI